MQISKITELLNRKREYCKLAENKKLCNLAQIDRVAQLCDHCINGKIFKRFVIGMRCGTKMEAECVERLLKVSKDRDLVSSLSYDRIFNYRRRK